MREGLLYVARGVRRVDSSRSSSPYTGMHAVRPGRRWLARDMALLARDATGYIVDRSPQKKARALVFVDHEKRRLVEKKLRVIYRLGGVAQ